MECRGCKSQDVRAGQTEEGGNSPSRVQNASHLVGHFRLYAYSYSPYLPTFKTHFAIPNEKEATKDYWNTTSFTNTPYSCL